jgi:glycosyltransferase involved in cell wall biosynthesis
MQRLCFLCERYDVTILSIFGCDEAVRCLPQDAYVCPGRKWLLHYLIFPVWVLLAVYRLGRARRVDCVYTTYFPLALLSGMLVKRILRVTWIADIWDDPRLAAEESGGYRGIQYTLKVIYFMLAARRAIGALHSADLVILSLAPGALKRFLPADDRVVYVTNGVEARALAVFRTQAGGAEASTPGDPISILYVGHVKRVRGVDTLLRMAILLKDRLRDFRLVLVGPGNANDLSWLDGEIRSCGLSNHVTLKGVLPHDEALTTILRADVCVIAFPRKGVLEYIYPIKVLEYMALGKVTVASHLAGIERIIIDRENGRLVPPESAEAFCEAVLETIRDVESKRAMESRAIEDAQHFEWSTINLRVGERIDELLSGRFAGTVA